MWFLLPQAGADLRHNAQTLQRPVERSNDPAPRDEQFPFIRQLRHSLYKPFAEGGTADHHGATMVSQSRGENFRGTRRASVYQNGNGQAVCHVTTLHSPDMVGLLVPPVGYGSNATVQQQGGSGYGLLQHTATVAPQVNNQAFQAGVLRGLIQILAHFFCRIGRKRSDAQHHERPAGKGENGFRRHFCPPDDHSMAAPLAGGEQAQADAGIFLAL